MTQNIRERIEASFARQTLMHTLGATLSHIDEGKVVIDAPLLPGSLQQHGFGHAGLTFSIGDSASGYAALSTLPDGYEVLTAETKINLLAPAQGDFLRATGWVIKPGKRLIVVSAEIHAVKDTETTVIAVMQGTLVPVSA